MPVCWVLLMPTGATSRMAGIQTSSRTTSNEVTEYMLIILEAGGFAGGGINFDAKIRRNSTDLADLFHAHIGV